MIALLVFASGFTALVYEIIWIKTLTLVFGTTIFAVSTVLTAFFSGLALGNRYFGKLSDRSRHPLILYGALELATGIYALLYPLVHLGVSRLYLVTVPSDITSTPAIPLVRFLLGLAALLPPTIMMGGTLPAVVRHAAGERGEVGRPLASLYAINTAGAALGTLVAGFFLIGTFGVRASMISMAAVNLSIAGTVFALYRRETASGPRSRGDGLARGRRGAFSTDRNAGEGYRFILLVSGLSGLASIGYEVVWTRMLIHYTGTTTYAFSTILVTFLVGISAGGYLARRLLGRDRDLWPVLAIIEGAIGLLALISTAAIDRLPLIDQVLSARLNPSGVGQWQVGLLISMIKNAAVMILPALCMGLSLPVAVGLVGRGVEEAGRTVGDLFSANTLGSIVGSFAAGFAFVPLMGTGWTITLLASLNLLLALALIRRSRIERRKRNYLLVSGLLLLACVVSLSRKEMFREVYPPEDLVFFAEGVTSTVAVVRDEDPLNPAYLRMFVDGNGLSGTDYSGRRYMRLLGHLPVILAGGRPESALVICLGTGMTLGAVSRYRSVEVLDCVEISRGVVEASAFFYGENHGVLEDGRLNLILDDGRNYLLRTSRRYDVITLEPPPPRSAGVVNLYSREFYRQVRDHLEPGGRLCQWIPLHDQSEEDVKVLIRTFLDVFPHVTCWWIERNELALIGSVGPQSIDWERLGGIFDVPEVGSDLASIDITDPYDLLSLYLTDERGLREYVGGGEIVTDDRPVIEYFLFRGGNRTYRYSPYVREPYLPVLEEMTIHLGDVRSILRHTERLDRRRFYERWVTARHLIDATILRNQGKEDAARREFRLAVRRTGNGYAGHYLGISDSQLAEAVRRAEADPTNVDALNRAGYIYFERGETGTAVRYFRRVLDVDPTNLGALLNLGRALEEAGDLDAARRRFSRAKELAGGDLSRMIDVRLGIIAAIDSARTRPDPEAFHRIGLAYWGLKEYERAARWFERAASGSPGWEVARYNLAAAYETMRRYDEALRRYEESYRLTRNAQAENNVEKLRLFLAIEREWSGDIDLVNGGSLHVGWDDPAARNLLGIRFYRNGEYAQAVAAFLRAVREKPDYAEALVNAGDAYRAMGRAADAEGCYARAERMDPSLGEVLDRRRKLLEDR